MSSAETTQSTLGSQVCLFIIECREAYRPNQVPQLKVIVNNLIADDRTRREESAAVVSANSSGLL